MRRPALAQSPRLGVTGEENKRYNEKGLNNGAWISTDMPSLTLSLFAVTTGDIYRSPSGCPSIQHFLFQLRGGAEVFASSSGRA